MPDTAPPLYYQIFVLTPPQDPRRAWAATLECSTALDRGKAAVSSTLGALPHPTWSTVRPTATTTPSTSATGQGNVPGTVKRLPRMTATPSAMPVVLGNMNHRLFSPDSGRKRRLQRSPVHVICPSRDHTGKESRLLCRQPLALSSPHIGTCFNQL